MIDLTIDFESAFCKDVNLKKLATLEYIRHPKFKVFGAACKTDDKPAEWVTDLVRYFAQFDWPNVRVISHNSLFDLTVLHEKYGIHPGDRVDTLGLCRTLLPRDIALDLNSAGKLLGVGGKLDGGKALTAVKGVTDPTPEQLEELGRYAVADADTCYGLFKTLYPLLPKTESVFANQVLRFSTQGIFERDDTAIAALAAAEQEIAEDRATKLAAAGCTIKQLTSREQFAALLTQAGIRPPMKTSPANGQLTFAFSKQDSKFKALLTNPTIAPLVRARMAYASNNAKTRIVRLQNILNAWPHTLPVQLNVNGAHTGRLSGGGKINAQNLDARGLGSGIRKALRVRNRYVVCVLDQSGLELRMNMWFCGQDNVLDTMRNGGDVYIDEATVQYGVLAADVTDEQRFIGKVIRLAAQYGMGWIKFRELMAAGAYGSDPIYLTEPEAQGTINTYREGHGRVTAMWRWLNDAALAHMSSRSTPLEYRCLQFANETVTLPNGLTLSYPELKASENGWTWGFRTTSNIWGGTLLENIVQALAGIVIKDQMVAIDDAFDGDTFTRIYQQSQRAGSYRESLEQDIHEQLAGKAAVIHQVHDEILVACREQDADGILTTMKQIMRQSPSWAPDLPLEVKGGYAQEYSK